MDQSVLSITLDGLGMLMHTYTPLKVMQGIDLLARGVMSGLTLLPTVGESRPENIVDVQDYDSTTSLEGQPDIASAWF